MMTGADMVHVPYKGGAPALTDLIGGQVQVLFISAGASIQYIKTGQLRALGISSATRSEAMPDLPTIRESVPGYEVSSWFGIGAPRNTPADVTDRLNKEINAGLADPKIKARLADADATPFIATPAGHGTRLRSGTTCSAAPGGRTCAAIRSARPQTPWDLFPWRNPARPAVRRTVHPAAGWR